MLQVLIDNSMGRALSSILGIHRPMLSSLEVVDKLEFFASFWNLKSECIIEVGLGFSEAVSRNFSTRLAP